MKSSFIISVNNNHINHNIKYKNDEKMKLFSKISTEMLFVLYEMFFYYLNFYGGNLFSNFQLLSHRCIIANPLLLLPYFYGMCSDELCSFLPPVQTFASRTYLATFTQLNHPHSPYIINVKRKFYSEGLFQKNCYFGEETQTQMLT